MSPQNEPEIQPSVPLFSGTLYQGFYIGGYLWGLVLQILSYVVSITLDVFQWFLVTFLVGAFLHLFFYGWKRRRFRNPVQDPELLTLFEEVKNDIGTGHNIELWYRDIDRNIFLSTGTPFFKAMLFSESAIADILGKREKGKVLLAKEALTIERANHYLRMVIGILGFTLFAFLEAFSFGGSFGYIYFSLGPIIMVATFIGIVILIITIPYLSSRRQKDVNSIVEELYGFHPDAVRMEVLRGFAIPDELIEKVKRDEAEGPSRFLRKAAPVSIITLFVTFILIYVTLTNSPLRITVALLMSSFAAFGVFILAFVIGSAWPMIKPGSGTRDTEWDIHVPFASEVQAFLQNYPDLNRIEVRGVKPPSENEYGLVVLRLGENYEEKTLYGLLPTVTRDIHDVELIGPLILSEIRRDEIGRRSNLISYGVVGISIPFLAIGLLLSITQGSSDFVFSFIQFLFIYLFMAFVPLGYMSYWKRKAEIKSDAEIVITCPRFREALQTLIDNHHTLPYGKTSYRTRLERINKHLSIEGEIS